LTSFHRFAPRSDFSTSSSVTVLLAFLLLSFCPAIDVVVDRHRREGVGPLEHHAHLAADGHGVGAGA
jgi:hypothetical protein